MNARHFCKLSVLTVLLAGPGLCLFQTTGRAVGKDHDVGNFRRSWQGLDPISNRNLTVYPVVSKTIADESDLLTLDDGMASGQVKVMERGETDGAMYRGRSGTERWPGIRPERYPQGGAAVNELMLVNNSRKPLILLAGEVVSGGKQTRIIGADVIIPPKSEPVPLSVFCVEHGRWTSGSTFQAAKVIAQPSVRKEAQVNQSQQGVWNRVAGAISRSEAAAPTSSYLDALASPRAQRAIEQGSATIESDYERELRSKLSGENAVGVVVAINGQLVWADVFASPEVFHKYWSKLLRSYIMEAEGPGRWSKGEPGTQAALDFLLTDSGRVTIKEEPGAYRRTQITSPDFEVVALEAMGEVGGDGLLVHYNKMLQNNAQ
jgi:ARG and Rhodanese-Phosphatase-superfamily-associated Protein domain